VKKGETMEHKLLEHIEINPQVLAGKPVIKGTRISVELILRMLSQGISVEEILEEYPHLTEEDIKAALAYAAESLAVEEVLPLVKNE
jgi:uncharacterized protein (DUF433 family)